MKRSPVARSLVLGLAALLLTAPIDAHVISTSSGELHIEGPTATYELRLPLYELEHLSNPEPAQLAQDLLKEVWFKGATQTNRACAKEGDDFVCRADFRFDAPPGATLEAQITIFRATVPNHIHLLRATYGSNTAQEIFDQVAPLRELRFRPPSFLEQLWRDARLGAARLLTSVPALLFLLALSLIATSKRQAAGIAVAFLAGEWLVRPISALLPAGFSPAFLEAALALSVAYLAAEILWLQQGRAQWAVVPVLGLLHGLPFAPFPAGFLAGANAVQSALLAGLAFVPFKPLRKRAAACLLAAGLLWFVRAMYF